MVPEHDEKQQNLKTVMKEKQIRKNTGKLGGFRGHSITSTIRRMAKAGWDFATCRATFDALKIKVADTTSRIQLRDGGKPADISADELAKIKVTPPAKAKGKKSRKSAKQVPETAKS